MLGNPGRVRFGRGTRWAGSNLIDKRAIGILSAGDGDPMS